MDLQSGFITVTLRSHVTPSACIEGLELGKKMQIRLAADTTVRELAQKFFSQNMNHIGFIAVNGKIAAENTILQEGDAVDIYSLISGG
ncbi:MAG: MoaD/ThiS family protein [Peptococcaceae bacterium]|nr:MoaD/ThiS family protein [Peptococcaceae bacterium]